MVEMKQRDENDRSSKPSFLSSKIEGEYVFQRAGRIDARLFGLKKSKPIFVVECRAATKL